MRRILWISDGPHQPTGFGRVSREILSRLSGQAGLEVHALAVGSDDHALPESDLPFRIWPHPQRVATAASVGPIIRECRPDAVVTLSDVWTPAYMPELVRRWDIEWVGYFPIDAGPLPTYLGPLVSAMHRRVTTSLYSASVFAAAFPDMELTTIGHGVDTRVFQPGLPTRGRPALPDNRRAFIVGCVARNQPRKALPVLIEGFASFARRHDEALLYLHTNPWDPDGWVLRELLGRHGVLERTVFTHAMVEFRPLPDADLCNVYRTFDVFALPTTGEGFGMPILEAMACGVPVAATEGSAVSELVAGRGELIPCAAKLCTSPHGLEFSLPSLDGLVTAMERLYGNPELREEYSRKGLELARERTWDSCARQWQYLLLGTDAPAAAPNETLPALTAVVVVPDREALATWKSERRHEFHQKLEQSPPAGGVEYIVVTQESAGAFQAELAAAFGIRAVILQLPQERGMADRLRVALDMARAGEVCFVNAGPSNLLPDIAEKPGTVTWAFP